MSPRCPHCGGPVEWNMVVMGWGPFAPEVPDTYECEQGGDCPGIQAKLALGLPLTERCPNGHTAVRQMVQITAPGEAEDQWVPGEAVCVHGDLCRTRKLLDDQSRLLQAYDRRMLRPGLLTRLLRRLRKLTRGDVR